MFQLPPLASALVKISNLHIDKKDVARQAMTGRFGDRFFDFHVMPDDKRYYCTFNVEATEADTHNEEASVSGTFVWASGGLAVMEEMQFLPEQGGSISSYMNIRVEGLILSHLHQESTVGLPLREVIELPRSILNLIGDHIVDKTIELDKGIMITTLSIDTPILEPS